MSEQRIMEIQQGVWIDERWLQDAGLGSHVRVVVQPGEIRIVAVPEEAVPSEDSTAWNAFQSLGESPNHGRLRESATDHDKYLYSKK